jgi:hypothetical protein
MNEIATMLPLVRRLARRVLLIVAVAMLMTQGIGCSSVPRGAGNYMVTVVDAGTGRPVEGLALTAAGAGVRARGGTPVAATTDEDGVAVLRFGDWGAVDLALAQGDVTERWLVTQDRVAVNGGTSSIEPLRLIVGSRMQGGASAFEVTITRVERGGKIDK